MNKISELVFKSPEQWGGVVSKIRSGQAPCPICGSWVLMPDIRHIPMRYKPFIGKDIIVSDSFGLPIIIHRDNHDNCEWACIYCISQAATRRNEWSTIHCGRCNKEYKRGQLINSQTEFSSSERSALHRIEVWPIQADKTISPYVCNKCTSEMRTILNLKQIEPNDWTKFLRAGASHRQRTGETKMDLSFIQWIDTLNYFERKCVYCGAQWSLMEHFIPINLGGKFEYKNILPACHRCNLNKGSNPPDEFMGMIAPLMAKQIIDFREGASI